VDFYWLYDLETWQLFAVVILAVIAFAMFGAKWLRGRVERKLGLDTDSNDIVGYFLSFTGAFYGIMLGLVAVGAWETFNDANDAASKEAAVVAALYHDVTSLPAPHDGRAQAYLKSYAWDVINLEWPEQQQGKAPYSAQRVVDKLASEISLVDPQNARDEVTMAETIRQLNNLLEARRYRVEASNEALPPTLWAVIIVGGLMNLVITWLLVVKSPLLDLIINLLVASLLGAVLAFIIAMDNPFRGELSVSAQAMENVYEDVMDGSEDRPIVK
jgi:hypothetical protein